MEQHEGWQGVIPGSAQPHRHRPLSPRLASQPRPRPRRRRPTSLSSSPMGSVASPKRPPTHVFDRISRAGGISDGVPTSKRSSSSGSSSYSRTGSGRPLGRSVFGLVDGDEPNGTPAAVDLMVAPTPLLPAPPSTSPSGTSPAPEQDQRQVTSPARASLARPQPSRHVSMTPSPPSSPASLASRLGPRLRLRSRSTSSPPGVIHSSVGSPVHRLLHRHHPTSASAPARRGAQYPGSLSPGEQTKLARRQHLLAHPTNPATKTLLMSTYDLAAIDQYERAQEAGRWVYHDGFRDDEQTSYFYSDAAMSAGFDTTPPWSAQSRPSHMSVMSGPPDSTSTPPQTRGTARTSSLRQQGSLRRRSTASKPFSRYSISTRRTRPSGVFGDEEGLPAITFTSADDADAAFNQQPVLIRLRRRGIENFGEYMAWARPLPPGIRMRVDTIIRAAHELLQDYAVRRIELDGDRMITAAKGYATITPRFTIICAHDREQLAALIAKPGQRFKGRHGAHAAATVLQRGWRRVLQSKRHAVDESQALAVSAISALWATRVQRALLARRARKRQAIAIKQHNTDLHRVSSLAWRDILLGSTATSAPLSASLASMSLSSLASSSTMSSMPPPDMLPPPAPTPSSSSSPRASVSDGSTALAPVFKHTLLLHMPSVALSQRCRHMWQSFLFIQHRYNMRVLDALQPNTRVILIASMNWPQEFRQVYAQIMSDLTGVPTTETMERFEILPPAHAEFPTFLRLPLSKTLLYSPCTLLELAEKPHARGVEACVAIPALLDGADLVITQQLGATVVASDPTVTSFLRSKIKLFHYLASIKVPCPGHVMVQPGSSLAVVCKLFARLIVENEGYVRWTFMVDDSFERFGAVVIETRNSIAAMSYVRTQREHYQRLWKKGSKVQQSSIIRVGKELRTRLPELYTRTPKQWKARASVPEGWPEFLAFFVESGGVILVGDPFHLAPAGPHAVPARMPASQQQQSEQSEEGKEKGEEEGTQGDTGTAAALAGGAAEDETTFVVADVVIDPCGSWSLLGAWHEKSVEDAATGDVAKVFVSPPADLPQSVVSSVERITERLASNMAKKHVVGHASIRFVVDGPRVTVCHVLDCASDPYVCARWLHAMPASTPSPQRGAGAGGLESEPHGDAPPQNTTPPRGAEGSRGPLLSSSSSSASLSSLTAESSRPALLPPPGSRRLALIPGKVVIAANTVHLVYAAPVNVAVLYQLLRVQGLQRLTQSTGATLLPLDPKAHDHLAFIAYASDLKSAVGEANQLLSGIEREVCPASVRSHNILSQLMTVLARSAVDRS
ncbi:hypothetical protein PTSG_00512 [Salpingoeca rosetta]|uniref:IQCH-like ATP-grasp domain-containing protein n=1 Tax=Salpingoeca rosetta (strain ATCC 50818 / BSB-021) TaxID=946362 RepID=F2TWP0_SALR5|nr:uncharacterized protein PTSG_00512 [Salpingoeca rosetta]EGD72486.1 hypothetical protein PTSG_00512 [Salpingoeca rosetta]|eukprot:XP_004999055.1 hypothetical protein PTSG_00512 [Salpingoeca rosetta]